jgi:hypothetical protein
MKEFLASAGSLLLFAGICLGLRAWYLHREHTSSYEALDAQRKTSQYGIRMDSRRTAYQPIKARWFAAGACGAVGLALLAFSVAA